MAICCSSKRKLILTQTASCCKLSLHLSGFLFFSDMKREDEDNCKGCILAESSYNQGCGLHNAHRCQARWAEWGLKSIPRVHNTRLVTSHGAAGRYGVSCSLSTPLQEGTATHPSCTHRAGSVPQSHTCQRWAWRLWHILSLFLPRLPGVQSGQRPWRGKTGYSEKCCRRTNSRPTVQMLN